ncbi:MAG: ribosome recycling factor [candidate division NC10 bacterium]|nr:ribosome recycling factor [candidate division NC10 bacterium]MBI4840583.1 ribosome recycling factor [candidate division NC10 bacterium]
MQEIIRKAEQDMKRATEATVKDFNSVRTGRASLTLLDGIQVDYHGTLTPLNRVASLAIPERRLITIQPWEPSLVPVIEKAILKSDLGITPSNDGKIIRLAIPTLTEERRKELVKVVKKMAEEGRVIIRNLRRDANEALKKLEKNKQASEDAVRKGMEQVQELTNRMIKNLDELLEKKEKEIMEF